MLDEIIKKAVKEYQCPGCVNGPGPTCYQPKSGSEACGKHVAGTMMATDMGIGSIFLGMPKGFNRLGPSKGMKINIFRELKDGWGFDFLNVPVWKFKDEHGNVIVRGLAPRTSSPFLHIFLEDCMKEIDCLEITEKELEEID